MVQMSDAQIQMAGMVMEMYRNHMQSQGTMRHVGGVPVPSRALANFSEQGLPKAAQERLEKEREPRERQQQQQAERAIVNMQALKDWMPGQHSSSEATGQDAACSPIDCAHASRSAYMQSVSASDAAESLCPDQAAPCPELLVPGKNRLHWTQWLGKRVGISGRYLHNATT